MSKRTLRCSVTMVFAAMLIGLKLFSQAPNVIPYQAIARDNKGELISNRKIALRFTIREGSSNGSRLYQEVQHVTTNSVGSYNVNIGQGQVISGKMDAIQWGTGNKFEQVEIDPEGNNAFSELSCQQIVSVPYSLYSQKAGDIPFRISSSYDTLFLGNSFLIIPGISNANNPVQSRLERGETPYKIYRSGVPIDSLYGKLWQGGLIFYLDSLRGNGLVCAQHDQAFADWGVSGGSVCGAHGQELGTGMENTKAIVNGVDDDTTAARVCDKLKLNGYNDWFLPSKDELNLIYTNIKMKGLGGFGPTYYWSSTESGAELAWSQFFFSGSQVNFGKNFSFAVRAVRGF